MAPLSLAIARTVFSFSLSKLRDSNSDDAVPKVSTIASNDSLITFAIEFNSTSVAFTYSSRLQLTNCLDQSLNMATNIQKIICYCLGEQKKICLFARNLMNTMI